jgi:hypothetical protein
MPGKTTVTKVKKTVEETKQEAPPARVGAKAASAPEALKTDSSAKAKARSKTPVAPPKADEKAKTAQTQSTANKKQALNKSVDPVPQAKSPA